jgi:hypothetical protein
VLNESLYEFPLSDWGLQAAENWSHTSAGPTMLLRANLLPSNYPMNCALKPAAVENHLSSSRNSKCQKLACIFAVAFLFTHCPSLLQAQETPLQSTSVAGTQQPGAGAQLYTGNASGLSIDARLQILLADHQYALIASRLGLLPPLEAQFYRGILANRSNDVQQSIKLLEPLVDNFTQSGDISHQKLLRMTLAEDYLRLGEWSKAAAAYQFLESRLKASLAPDEQDAIEMPLKLLPLAKDNPPTIVEPCDPFKLMVTEDPLGLIDVPVFIDARSRSWMLDPTLPFNLIARSSARDAGLRLSDASATVTSLTGRPIPIHSTVIPRFTIGGRLTLRDMTAFVFDDNDYYFPGTSYQVEGVLGYPALAAIGSLTVNSDNTIFVHPARQIAPPEKDDQLVAGAPFYLDGDRVIVALGPAANTAPESHSRPAAGDPQLPPAETDNSSVEDGERMYAVDAGGQQTYLTSRYFDENSAQFNGQKMRMYSFFGNQSPPQPAYLAENVSLEVGAAALVIHDIRVLTQPLGSAALDDVYGVLGADALGQLKSYTFDYRTMRFSATAQ